MVQKDKKEKAFALRLQGRSYGEILKELDIPSKGTLSAWFKDLKLSPEAEKRLESKRQFAIKKGLMAFNKRRTKSISLENQKILAESLKEIPKLSEKDLLLIGTALYWGEGSNREHKKNLRLSFSNSDPRMAKVYLKYLRSVLRIPDDKIKAGIYLHPNIKKQTALRVWSEATQLSKLNFYFVSSISSASKLKRPKNFLPFGTVHIHVNKRQLFYRVRGHIQGIINHLLSLKPQD